MPNTTRLLAGWSSNPTISLFEPPAQGIAFAAGGANASFGLRRNFGESLARSVEPSGRADRLSHETPHDEPRTIAAGCEGQGQDISKHCGAIRQWLAQVVSI
jgi:hypothetical protein